jgi:predicted acetyltransferase
MTSSKDLILRSLTLKDENAFVAAVDSWDLAPGFIFAFGYEPGMKFSDYLELVDANTRGERLPEGYVPVTALCGFVGKDIVGRVSIRHELNDFLSKIGGHIGYGVVPEFRKKGYAKEMLAQTLPVAKKIGIKKALLTCDDDNIGSIKTIEAHGGIFENKIDPGNGRPLKRRYWINLSD